MAKAYGPVTGFYLGPFLPFISVDGKKAVKEALHNNDLNGRRPAAGRRVHSLKVERSERS